MTRSVQEQTHMSSHQLGKRLLTGAAAAVLAFSAGIIHAPAAYAGPDQDKSIFTRQHVDAPVPAWDPKKKELFILANKELGQNSVLYLGRGWRNRVVKHLFSTPNNVPALNFLGEAGKMWLAAPQDPGQGNTPIWAGIGVDGSLSSIADQLENGNYVLDLVDVRGPGRVESFIWTPWRVNRLFSSADINHRTVWNPRHTHSYTIFSKPGRYELNVAAVTRSADGQTVYTSPVTPIVWQVGGADPREGKIKDYGAAYNEARVYRTDGRDQKGTLTLKPKTAFKIVGDDVLTDFLFNTGNAADQGHVIILIDGFYLTEVPVVNGRASFDEMIGDEQSSFQAIYIPSDDVSARYATTPVSFSRTTQSSVSSEGAAQTLQTPVVAPSPELLPDQHQVVDGEVTVTITPIEGDDDFNVHVEGDTDLNAEISMSWHKNSDTNIPDCSFERQMIQGRLDVVADIRYCLSSAVMRVTMNPHPYSNAKPQNFELSDFNFENGRTFTFELPLREQPQNFAQAPRISGWSATPYDPQTQANAVHPAVDPSTSTPSEDTTVPDKPQPSFPGGADSSGSSGSSIAPTKPQEGTGTGSQPSPQPLPEPSGTQHSQNASVQSQPIRLHRGHMDIRLTPNANNQWRIAVKDDSLIGARTSVVRTPESVTVIVPEAARQPRNQSLAGEQFDFLGPIGTSNYLLPEVENSALPWPGLSTEDVDYSAYPQGIDYRITATSLPRNGRVFFATTADLGAKVQVHVDSNDPRRHTVHTEEATHLHGVWGFSAPGTYNLKVEAMSGNTLLASAPLRFEVGDQNNSAPQTSANTTSENRPNVQPHNSQNTNAGIASQAGNNTQAQSQNNGRAQGQTQSQTQGQAQGTPTNKPGVQSQANTQSSGHNGTQVQPSTQKPGNNASQSVRTSSRRAGAPAPTAAAASGLPAQRGVLGLGGGTVVKPNGNAVAKKKASIANVQNSAHKAQTAPHHAGVLVTAGTEPQSGAISVGDLVNAENAVNGSYSPPGALSKHVMIALGAVGAALIAALVIGILGLKARQD